MRVWQIQLQTALEHLPAQLERKLKALDARVAQLRVVWRGLPAREAAIERGEGLLQRSQVKDGHGNSPHQAAQGNHIKLC